MNYRSFSDMNDAIVRNLAKFPHDVDLVVGIPRSGMMPANLLAMYLNKPYTSIEQVCNGVIYANGKRKIDDNWEIRKVLVVDDSVGRGNQMKEAKEALAGFDFCKVFAAIYVRPENADVVDVYCETVESPRLFQWNIFNCKMVEKSMYDIDGVLCADPEIDDDGEQYIEAISNAKPLFVPKYTIDTIITCRLEKYRDITAKWLQEHGITYKRLIMLAMETKEERQKWGKHGDWKAYYYSHSRTKLFVESSLSQAQKIHQITGKPVFCTKTMSFV